MQLEVLHHGILESDAKNESWRNYATRFGIWIELTKEEAARLLSKCNNGGVLQFKDVAHELAFLVNRVNIVPDAQC